MGDHRRLACGLKAIMEFNWMLNGIDQKYGSHTRTQLNNIKNNTNNK
jgi:hypothetical protein